MRVKVAEGENGCNVTLRDGQGAERILLRAVDGNVKGKDTVPSSIFRLMDQNKKIRADLGALGERTYFYLGDENLQTKVLVDVFNKRASLKMSDENGRERIRLDVGKSGPGLDLMDGNGKILFGKP
ncbi:MAG: hypothetical protein K2R98_29090 [Gemmataceae bacterium]|nr:hypothetical protein [Gemmataceae bacterium]